MMQSIKSMTNDRLELPTKGSKALLVAFVLACFSHGTSQAYAQEQKPKVIYFLSGIRDHASPTVGGRHEVAKDLLVLQDCINKAYNLKGVKIVTKFIDARSALDVEDIKDADALIVESSSATSSQKADTSALPAPAAGPKKIRPADYGLSEPVGRSA